MIILERTKKFFIIGLVFIALICGSYFSYRYYINNSKIDISGHIINSQSGELITKDIKVFYQDKEASVNNGIFNIEKVKRYGTIKVEAPQLYTPIEIAINNRKKFDISINLGMELFMEKFLMNLTQKKYKYLYSQMEPSVSAKISEDDFVNIFNKWSEQLNKQGYKIEHVDYQIVESDQEHKSKISNQKYDGVEVANIVWHITKNDEQSQKITPSYFKQDLKGFVWIYNQDFLF